MPKAYRDSVYLRAAEHQAEHPDYSCLSIGRVVRDKIQAAGGTLVGDTYKAYEAERDQARGPYVEMMQPVTGEARELRLEGRYWWNAHSYEYSPGTMPSADAVMQEARIFALLFAHFAELDS